MSTSKIKIYVTGMAAAAAVCLSVVDWAVLDQLSVQDKLGFATLVVLALISETASIRVRLAQSVGHSQLMFIPFLASVLLFGPAAGVILATIVMLVGEFFLHKKGSIQAVFNVSQWVIASSVSGLLYGLLRSTLGIPQTTFPEPLSSGLLLIPFTAFVVTLFATNYIAVATAISLSDGRPFATVLRKVAGSAGANLGYGILISPLAFLVGVLYLQFDFRPLGLGIAVFPLLFIRRAYLTHVRLQEANRDLLKALVKAIETRDPYTSGHSLRVSRLAGRIAEALALPPKQVDLIETAGLLHDIGKIDADYSEILQKPDSLSLEERQMIESHVTRGVELLRQLSTFDNAVLDAVRHHHEREDGKGYPDRLKGSEIPIGAKIIKVCDAIDAMLSDRPYRDALELFQVKEQLRIYSGVQFDENIVACVVANGVLEDHQEQVTSQTWEEGIRSDERIRRKKEAPHKPRPIIRSMLEYLPQRGRPSLR